MPSISHGGNPAEVRRRYGLGDQPLIDFSASVNPLGPPPRALAAARDAMGRISRHPEAGCARLTARLAEMHGVPVECVIVGAGTTELIGLLGQSLREVLTYHALERGDPQMPISHVGEPTYGEYRRISVLNAMRTEVWSENVLSWELDYFPATAAGIFWTGHPNNPTGRAWNRAKLVERVDASLGLLTVVDEAFLPFFPDEAERTLVAEAAARENLLILRSLTKFYGMPGLRVGYAVGSPDLVTRLRQYQDPWTVTEPAEAAALSVLEEDEFRERTICEVGGEAARLAERLWDVPGVRPAWPWRTRPAESASLPNFVLISLTDTLWTSLMVHRALARRGFLVRECSDFLGLEVGALLTGQDQLVATQGHLRISVRRREENDALTAALTEVLRSEPPR